MGQGQVEQPVLRELVRPHVRARVRRSNHQRRQNRRNARHVRLHRENGPRCPPDCQEAVGKSEYNVIVVENGLRVNHVSGTFYLEFESCQGYEYQANVGPDDYETELNLGELKATSNDLAGFVYKQYLEGKITDYEVGFVNATLIGYSRSDLDLQNNDKQREEACEDAFRAKYSGD